MSPKVRGKRSINSSSAANSAPPKKRRRSERLIQHPPRSFKEPKQKHLPSAFHPFDAPDKYKVDPHNIPSKRWLAKKYWKRSVVGTNYYESLVSELSKRNPDLFGFTENTHYQYGIAEVTLNHCKHIDYSLKHGTSEEQYYYLESLVFFLNSDHFDWLVQSESLDNSLLDAIVRLSGAAILGILRSLDDVYWTEKSNLNLLLGLAFYFLVNQALVTEGGGASTGGWYLHAMEEARKHRLAIWDGLQHIEELNRWYRSVKVEQRPASDWDLDKLLATAVEIFHSNEQGDRWDIMKLTHDQRLNLEVDAQMGAWPLFHTASSLGGFDPAVLFDVIDSELYENDSVDDSFDSLSESEQRGDDEDEEEDDHDFWNAFGGGFGFGGTPYANYDALLFGLSPDLHSSALDLSL